jgi:hypothetical protein
MPSLGLGTVFKKLLWKTFTEASGLSRILRETPLATLQNKWFESILKNITTAAPGSRAWPNKKLDAKAGARLDYGGISTSEDGLRYRNLVFQANAEAENPTLKALAGKGTHDKLGTIALNVDKPDEDSLYQKRSGICKS